MPTKRINQILMEIPFERKLVATGAILMVISLFLPWYSDKDSFNTGSVFTGLNGPLYLVGFTFLIISSITLLFVTMEYLNKKITIFPVKPAKTYMWFGIASFYLLILMNSVYFDHNFGINITQKLSQFGTFIAFIAAAFLTVGGYLSTRERTTALKEFEDETREVKPVMKMPIPEQQRSRENVRTVHVDPVNPMKVPLRSEPATAFVRNPGSVRSNEQMGERLDVQNVAVNPENQPQPIRMDL